MHTRPTSTLALASLVFGWPGLVHGSFEPLGLTTNSYNQDIIIEKTASPPLLPVTTASMEQGTANSGFSWFERGYVPDFPVTGLPAAGAVLTSQQFADHHYQMPASYTAANAVLIDSVHCTVSITLNVPTKYAALSLLTSSGVAANTLRYTVWYGTNASESGTLISPNWYGGVDPAWVTSGRVDVNTFAHADVTAYNPRLYSVDLKLTYALAPVTRIDLSMVSGDGHTVIFAVSGALALGSEFLPVDISGYNEDMVVEAGAIQPGCLDGGSTATMDDGTANTRYTWYEKGYYPAAPETGLPQPGSLVTSESDPDHRFIMPPSYRDKNALLLDATRTDAVLVLANPKSCCALSFLAASAHGPATNQCVIGHANGTFETNRFVIPDWLAPEPPAVTSHGRVSVSTKLAERVNTEGPRLFAIDVPVVDTNSPVAKITLSSDSKSSARVAVLAVSGAAPGTIISRPALAITATPDGHLTVRSSQPGRLQSSLSLGRSATNWVDEGPITLNRTIAPAAGEPARFYRVAAP